MIVTFCLKVPLVIATKDTLKRYGSIVYDFDQTEVEITPWPTRGHRKLFPGTGQMGGFVSGDFIYTNGRTMFVKL